MKDLEMQLETVTENLNALNASSMNSILLSTERIRSDESLHEPISHGEQREPINNGEQVDSKEKLLQHLHKNEELKDLSHSLIRALKQR